MEIRVRLFPLLALSLVASTAVSANPVQPARSCSQVSIPEVPAPRSCSRAVPVIAKREIRSAADGLALLGSITQLRSKLGQPVLTSNYETTVAINNHATRPVQEQALIDAQITDENANVLADGLGKTMGEAYRNKAYFCSDNDGRSLGIGEIEPAVTALINDVNKLSSRASGEGKCAYANGVEPNQEGRYTLPPGGTFDVFGLAYDHPAGSKGADPYGNSRPFQTAPIGAASGASIRTYDAKDFFGVGMNSAVVLRGANAADRKAGLFAFTLEDNPAYPSGHTTFGYTESLILAMMVPERLRALAYRGSEYGDSRIVVGAHYALDVIGGRTLATYVLAQNLAGTPGYAKSLRPKLITAASALRDYLKANGCPSIAACAREPIVRADEATVLAKGEIRAAKPAEAYAFRLNYGLAPMGPTDRAPDPVPVQAASLLETRFPYLTQAQRLDILRMTEGPSGHFLDIGPLDGKPLALTARGAEAEAGVYSRLNLFAAAGGYTHLADRVVVNQVPSTDPDLKPFDDLARADIWSNDISGPGGLTKRGSGSLTLSGTSTYAGSTDVEGGTLDVAGSLRSAVHVKAGGTLAGTGRVGDVSVAPAGGLAPGDGRGSGSLAIEGSLRLAKGASLSVRDLPADGALKIAGRAELDGATLTLGQGERLQPGAKVTLIGAAGGVSGTFARVTTADASLVPKLVYTSNAVELRMEPASQARTETPKP